jgi:hypothetical protein
MGNLKLVYMLDSSILPILTFIKQTQDRRSSHCKATRTFPKVWVTALRFAGICRPILARSAIDQTAKRTQRIRING